MKRILIVIALLSAMSLQAQTTQPDIYIIGGTTLSHDPFIEAFKSHDSLHWSTYYDPSPDDTIVIDSTNDSFIKSFEKNHQLIWSTFYGFNNLQIDNDIDVSTWNEGVYFITIRSKDTITTQKFIKL